MKHFLTTIFLVVSTFCAFSQDSKISTVSDVFKWKQMGFIGSYDDKNYVKVIDNKETYTAVYDNNLKLVSKISHDFKVDFKEKNIIDQVLLQDKIIYLVKEVNYDLTSPELNAYIYDLKNTNEVKKKRISIADISKVYTGVIGKKGYARMGDFFTLSISKNKKYFSVTYNFIDSNGPFKQPEENDKITEIFSLETLEKVSEYKQPNIDIFLKVHSIKVDDFGKLYITYKYRLKNEDKEIQNKNLFFVNIIENKEVIKKIKIGEGEDFAIKSLQLTFDTDTFFITCFKSTTSSTINTQRFQVSEYNTKTLEKIRIIENNVPNLYTDPTDKKEAIPFILKYIKKLPNNDLLIIAEQYDFYYGYNNVYKVFYGNIVQFKTVGDSEFKMIHKIPYYLDGLSMRKTNNSTSIVIDEGDTIRILLEDHLDNVGVIGDKNVTNVSNFHADKNAIYVFTYTNEKLVDRKILIDQSKSKDRMLLREDMFYKTKNNEIIVPMLENIGKLQF